MRLIINQAKREKHLALNFSISVSRTACVAWRFLSSLKALGKRGRRLGESLGERQLLRRARFRGFAALYARVQIAQTAKLRRLCQAALGSNGCGTLRVVVSDVVYFSFKKGGYPHNIHTPYVNKSL